VSFYQGLPDKLRIGPYDYKVVVVDKITEDKEAWGLFEQGKLSITLSNDQANKLFAADTLLHEVLHAIYANTGIQALTPEEGVCSAMATGIIQVLRDNPKFRTWLIKHSTL